MSRHLFWAGPLAALAFAAPLQAQRAHHPTFQLTPYAGYLKAGNIANGPVGTALRNSGAPVYGAEVALGLTRGLALVGNVAYSKPGMEIAAPVVGGVNVGSTSLLLYDAALRLSLPLATSSISPFVQGGAGEIRQTVDVGPVSNRFTSFAYNLGGGVDVRVAPSVGVQLMAKDYIGKLDELDDRTTHNWALSAGVRLGF